MSRPHAPDVADLLDADRARRDEAKAMRALVLTVRCPEHDAAIGRPCGHLPGDTDEGTVCSARTMLWWSRHRRKAHRAGRLPPGPNVPPVLVQARLR